jgi:hypothetical protein
MGIFVVQIAETCNYEISVDATSEAEAKEAALKYGERPPRSAATR